MRLRIRVWRQASRSAEGSFDEYLMEGVEPQMSILELLDALEGRSARAGYTF